MGQWLPCFKAYDVRGKVPSELDPDLAYAIGRAYADNTGAAKVCVGYDIRLSGPDLADALARGLNDAGVDVVRLGLVGTEMVYFATAYYGFDGGVMITASHNPPEYNGMKMVRAESRPISGDTGLLDIERRAFEKRWERQGNGSIEALDCYADFVAHLLKVTRSEGNLNPLKLLADPGNGAAGLALDALLPFLPLDVEVLRGEPDGRFPNGVPNPILEESRAPTEARLRQARDAGKPFDFGVAWDGDYDRCFFLDGDGRFIEGYYIVGLLAQALLSEDPNQTVIYDPRLTWNTLDIVGRLGGRAVVCKSGHAFIKEKMRLEDASYGGEMSAHHYFRDHWYCDSGMIPMLLVAKLVSRSGSSLAELVDQMIRSYPCSGEINSTVASVPEVLRRVEAEYADGSIDHLDGLSVEFPQWRFNLRGSNTEPVIRLNVETRGDEALLREKVDALLALIRA
ncbi:MAG: phosphomannomutase CpsG [Fimbriimonadaceae bacterium]|nr:phosphomannomutase CpsG [Fimbriimonadaceae bacterium]